MDIREATLSKIRSQYATEAFILGSLYLPVKGMDELTIDEARVTGLSHWLNSQSRCFGDKGDVEDITEGRTALARS